MLLATSSSPTALYFAALLLLACSSMPLQSSIPRGYPTPEEEERLAQERQWNLVAFNIGPTPIYDEGGRIIPIGEAAGREGRRYKVYVVWYGRCIGIFYSWYVPLSSLR